MSVYTSVSNEALASLLDQYNIGTLTSLKGIRDGIENSNYFLSTCEGEFVLTVFESMQMAEVPFCMQLMHYLARHEIPCADPIATNNGCYVVELMGKPASIVSRLEGHSVSEATLSQIEALGASLGRWHKATAYDGTGEGFGIQREDRYDKKWRQRVANSVMETLAEEDQQLLQAELDLQRLYSHNNLPQGIIHSDLFRDNALFVGTRLSGIIDLYDACSGPLLYDIAVVVNDWCRKPDGSIHIELAQQFLASYHAQRALSSLERGAWPILLRAAALRFWLSRLERKNRPKMAKLQPKKEPQKFKIILQNCILEEAELTELWVT